MNSNWTNWGVLENANSLSVPGFMISPGVSEDGDDLGGSEETPGDRVREAWDHFVEILNANGPGTGYDQLLDLRENMEARREEIRSELKRWKDRKDRLTKLKGRYHLKLQELAGVENPSSIWRTHEANDPVEQLPNVVTPLADQPIVESFVDFDDDGRLPEWPDLEGNWKLSTGALFRSPSTDMGTLLPKFGRQPEDVDARRENTTVRYHLSNEQLEQAGIDPDNLDSRLAIQMEPSTTWREALVQIEKREHEMKEEKKPLKRTLRVLDFRMDILENVLHRFETFGSTEKLTESGAQEIAEESQPGRKSTLNDPETYPGSTLKAVLEWTGDDANRRKPFRSKSQSSLCGFVSERLEEKAGYQVPQTTIKERLLSMMDEMDVQLPHGPTNTHSYFEAHEEIAEAMQEHGLV